MEDYSLLFSITIKHNYFTDGNIPGLIIEPDPVTKKTLSSLHFVFRQTISGINIFYDTNYYPSKDYALYEGKKLTFSLIISDHDFKNYTQLPLTGNSIFCFSNINKSKGKLKSPLNLTVKDFPDKEDLYQLKPSLFTIPINKGMKAADIKMIDVFEKNIPPASISGKEISYAAADGFCYENQKKDTIGLYVNSFIFKSKPFAVIEIFLFEKRFNSAVNVFEKGKNVGKNYAITFDSRSARWRYYIVNKSDVKVDNLSIKSTKNKIMFVKKESISAVENPVFVLVSKSAIKMQQYSNTTLDLILTNNKGSNVLTNIQIPSVKTFKTENKTNFIDTYIYI